MRSFCTQLILRARRQSFPLPPRTPPSLCHSLELSIVIKYVGDLQLPEHDWPTSISKVHTEQRGTYANPGQRFETPLTSENKNPYSASAPREKKSIT